MKLKTKPTHLVELDGEKIHFRKDIFGWHQVFPVMDENGKLNWKNFIAGGSWIKLGLVVLLVILIIGCIYEYSQAVQIANDCLAKTIVIELDPAKTLQGIMIP